MPAVSAAAAARFDFLGGLCEPPAPGRGAASPAAAPASLDLAAFRETRFASRFCGWTGRSGRRYIASIYPAAQCPAYCDAILIVAIRDAAGGRRILAIRDTGTFPEPVVARVQHEFADFGAAVELHLHLLCRSLGDRQSVLADLFGAADA